MTEFDVTNCVGLAIYAALAVAELPEIRSVTVVGTERPLGRDLIQLRRAVQSNALEMNVRGDAGCIVRFAHTESALPATTNSPPRTSRVSRLLAELTSRRRSREVSV